VPDYRPERQSGQFFEQFRLVRQWLKMPVAVQRCWLWFVVLLLALTCVVWPSMAMPQSLTVDSLSVPRAETREPGFLQRFFDGSSDAALLPPEQAFPVTLHSVAEDVLVVRFETAPGYYLYRDRLDFDSATVSLPDGVTIEDPNFGIMEVYRAPFEAYLQLPEPPVSRETVRIGFQGCSDSGLCYPPMQAQFVADGSGGWARLDANGTAGGSPPAPASGSDLAGLAAGVFPEGALLPMLLAFFVAGIGLSLTACMYPLVPILSGLIAGDRQRSAPRAFWLSFVFVQATAVTYALAGVAAGLSGAAVQASMQHPFVLGGFAALFVAMALAMFGLITVQMPVMIQSRIDALARQQRGGRLISVVVMGVLSALIVGACSGPALIAALAFISNTGDAWLGGLALFVMANGMGVPLLLVGTAFGRWLPSSGHWMNRVKQGFGFVFLGVAVWMVGRLLDLSITLALWGLLLAAIALWLALIIASPWRWRPLLQVRRLAQMAAVGVAAWGLLLLGGASVGGVDPLTPLANFDASQRDRVGVVWESIDTPAALEQRLADARQAGRPVVIDVYADWCVYCVQLDRQTFASPAVIAALDHALRLKIDVTAMSADDRALLQTLQVFLPPAVLFVGTDGRERGELRVNGFVDADRFVELAGAALGHAQPVGDSQ